MSNYYEKNRETILQKLAMKRLPHENANTHGSVYRLFIDDHSYVGSTKMDPNLRYKLHLSAFKRYTCGNGAYCSAFRVFEHGDPTFEVLETVPIEELDLREKYWSQQFQVVNKNRIGLRVKNDTTAYYRQWLDDRNPEKVQRREFKRMAKISCN